MKRKLFWIIILYGLFDLLIGGYCGGLLPLTPLAAGQINPLTQTIVMAATAAPPALLNSQSFSNNTNTGFSTSSTGGAIAAGTYRCGVTFYTATNTETPLSTDTATTSTITTIGTTSTVTIQAPAAVGVGANVVGYRPYCGVTAGATGAETLVVINSTVCTLSSSSTPSCSLLSPALLTLQSQFAAGSGGPATPGTALYQPVTNAANTAVFENSLFLQRVVNWTVAGTAPSACTFNVQTSATTVASLANVGQTITCTGSGSYSLPLNSSAVYSAVNVATFTAGDFTTKVTFTYTVTPFGLPIWWANAAPTSACSAATSGFFIDTAVPSLLYTCVTVTWTAVQLP